MYDKRRIEWMGWVEGWRYVGGAVIAFDFGGSHFAMTGHQKGKGKRKEDAYVKSVFYISFSLSRIHIIWAIYS